MFRCCILRVPAVPRSSNTPFLVAPQLRNAIKQPSYGTCRFSTLMSKQCRSLRQSTQLSSLQFLRRTGTSSVNSTVKQGLADGLSDRARKAVGWWLFGCAGMCFGAVALGGVTRLTESGLSMVDWKLFGRPPPRSSAEWEEEFNKYKAFPEYQYHVAEKGEMSLGEFKFIWLMEYTHRMWGRTIGVVFLLPAIFFWSKGWITKPMKPRIGIYGGLLLFQGLLGWYMVKSGLKEKKDPNWIPRVSQYRLASHLGSAFILYSLFLWGSLSHLLTPQMVSGAIPGLRKLQGLAHANLALIFLTAMSGAFVAGLDAGLVYNSWPKMADKWIPDDILAQSPKWKNIFENATTVQFNHRHLGELTATSITLFWLMSRKVPLPPRARLAMNALFGMAMIQVSLGITTLLTYVPTHLAATHQSGSLVLLSIGIWLMQELKRLPK
ncbi:cytochrome c oxidase assembly protein COX15 homolog [Lingula anatina]|uniref:Cytochrome c oxidase assembly protein COX15 homolog n=1 Tax=Lingula anatina TaxID=7574 RepID=A0A1S3JHD0_LINAN|nr:cytochrome c oxidase assembly protein COX15 homolog [Lingula anatina]|eukprot:XP_013409546.1 cytochrome c oxidase assembly protein COX15 homolog [Lingula anatina]